MKKQEKQSPADNPSYVKYIGLAFQMGGIIGLGTWLGFKVQTKSNMNFPVWILLFFFVSISIAFYQLFQSIKEDNNH